MTAMCGDQTMTGADVIVGVGCHDDAGVDDLVGLVRATLAGAGVAPARVAGLATLDRRAADPAVVGLAARLGVPLHAFPAARLEAETPRLATPSAAVFRAVGCHGVAEAAALAAAGPAASLLVPKRRSGRATCALALATGHRSEEGTP